VQEANKIKFSAIKTSSLHEDEYRYKLPTIFQVTPWATGLHVKVTVLQLFKKHPWFTALYSRNR
jgi:hypothetical protein